MTFSQTRAIQGKYMLLHTLSCTDTTDNKTAVFHVLQLIPTRTTCMETSTFGRISKVNLYHLYYVVLFSYSMSGYYLNQCWVSSSTQICDNRPRRCLCLELQGLMALSVRNTRHFLQIFQRLACLLMLWRLEPPICLHLTLSLLKFVNG